MRRTYVKLLLQVNIMKSVGFDGKSCILVAVAVLINSNPIL